MHEYIELEALKEAFKSVTDDCTCPIHLAAEIDQILDQSPVADVVPVRHGRWMFGGDGIVECSVCNETYDVNMMPRNYCPNCWAKMDLK